MQCGGERMPKVTWISRPRKPVNYLAAVLREYKRAAGLTSAQIADMMECTPEHVRALLGKPADNWRIGQLKQFCDVIGCPYSEAFEAAAK